MPKFLNAAISSEYDALFTEDFEGLFVQPVGMNVADNNAFRALLGESGLRMRLVKGSLARRVLEQRGLGELDFVFEGPAAIIVPLDDVEVDAAPVVAAKLVAAWRKESGSELPAVKGGRLEGKLLDGSAAQALERIPDAPQLRARIAGQVLAPGRRLASQITAPAARLAGGVKAHIDRLEKAGRPA